MPLPTITSFIFFIGDSDRGSSRERNC